MSHLVAKKMIELRDVHLRDKIPENLLRDEKVKRLADALSKPLQGVTAWAYKLNYTQSLKDLPDEIIEHLLWENHIGASEGLRLAKTKEEKINLIESSIELHRTKGTPHAIEKALEAVGLKGQVEEWFQYDGDPYWFLVELSVNNKLNDLDDIQSLIMEYKNKRSWFDGFVIAFESEVVVLVDDSYDYPVTYPLCGQFWGVKEFTEIDPSWINLIDDSYDYPVIYPMTMKGSFLVESETLSLVDDSYDFDKVYRLCGEMITLNKESSLMASGTKVVDDSYSYSKEYRMCGQFSCGE